MSFSQEMKDFLGAWQSTSKMGTDAEYKDALTAAAKGQEARASDPDTLDLQQRQGEATLKGTLANTAAVGQRLKNEAEQTAIYRKMLERGGGGGMGLAGMGYGGGAVPAGSAPATSAATPAVPASAPAVPYVDNSTTKEYAGGGAIDDGNDDNEDDASAPTSTTTDISARKRLPPQLLADAHSAALDGTAGMMALHGLGRGGIRTALQKQAALAYQQGAGGLSPQEMQMAEKAVDPDGTRFSDAGRKMAALGSVWQFFQQKGEPQKAQLVAGQMMQHFNAASQRYAALAKIAADNGDLDMAGKAALKSYANVPDGNDMALVRDPDDPNKLVYSFTDNDGKTVLKGVATPDELGAHAMGMASGGFHKALLTAAGQREEAAGKGPKEPTMSDRKNLNAMIEDPNSPVTKAYEADKAAKEKAGQAPDDEHWSGLKDATSQILQDNPKATVHSAFNAAQELLRVNPDDENPKMPFKVISAEDKDQHTIEFKNGLKAELNTAQLNEVMNRRAAALKASDAQIDQEVDDEDKPTFGSRAAKVGAAVGSALTDGSTEPLAGGTAFPGGAQPAPEAVAQPDPYRNRPYVPVLANHRRATGAIPD